MKYTYSEIRQKAWNSLDGKIWSAVCLMLIYAVLSLVGNVHIVCSIVALLLLPMAFQLITSFLVLARTNELPQPAWLFEPYKNMDNFLRLFLIKLLKNIFIFLWSLLFIVPGIIMSCAYAMAEFVAYDHPELTPMEAIRKSKEMMRGHKWDLFVLTLTFMGWFLLACLTCGLLLFFVIPYMRTAFAHFYLSLKEEDSYTEPVITAE